MDMYEDLKTMVREFPQQPGVYLMKNSPGKIIYVGKAKNLKKRVGSYFTGTQPVKTRVLVSKIKAIEYIVTQNEYEALLLENNLIKKNDPRYNIDLKDGKSYPSIRVTNEKFPRIFRTRRIVQDGSEYFGPFTNVEKIDVYLELIEKLFPLRKCRGPVKKREHPCLYYHIGRCASPCTGKISQAEYMKHVEAAKKLLSGETKDLLQDLERQMDTAARALNYEKAAELRDTIEAVKSVGVSQEVVDYNFEKRDYVAVVQRDTLCSFVVFQMRSGKMSGRDLFRAESFGDEEEAFSEFFFRYYGQSQGLVNSFPDVIYTSSEVDVELLQRFFREELRAEVKVKIPQKGRHSKILKMALQNAVQDVDRRLKAVANIPGLEELKSVLSLPKLPRRIEGFDIAQLSGKHPVASLVSFYNGNPDKKNYRRFHIKTLDGKIDDYEAIREAVARRYTRVLNENLDQPDLIVIDGGRGQLNAAKGILDSLGLQNIPVIGLAKQFEEIFMVDREEPIRLPEGAEGLQVLQAVRDETHRFATTFNRNLRQKDLSLDTLGSIPGIGPKRGKRLLQEFGSISAIKNASAQELSEKADLPLGLAQEIHQKFAQERDRPVAPQLPRDALE
ncbi:MAG: excinuclease ABC subunit UvrC [Spirochaetia bacterium]